MILRIRVRPEGEKWLSTEKEQHIRKAFQKVCGIFEELRESHCRHSEQGRELV